MGLEGHPRAASIRTIPDADILIAVTRFLYGYHAERVGFGLEMRLYSDGDGVMSIHPIRNPPKNIRKSVNVKLNVATN